MLGLGQIDHWAWIGKGWLDMMKQSILAPVSSVLNRNLKKKNFLGTWSLARLNINQLLNKKISYNNREMALKCCCGKPSWYPLLIKGFHLTPWWSTIQDLPGDSRNQHQLDHIRGENETKDLRIASDGNSTWLKSDKTLLPPPILLKRSRTPFKEHCVCSCARAGTWKAAFCVYNGHDRVCKVSLLLES